MPKALLLPGSIKTKTKTTTPATRFMESAIATSFARTPPLNTSTEAVHSKIMFKFVECIDSCSLNKIKKAISDHSIFTDLWTCKIIKLKAKEKQDKENAKKFCVNQYKLKDKNKAITDLEALDNEVQTYWFNIKFYRNIGHIQYAAAITVNVKGGLLYTSD
jgi:hypothetical protein